MNDQNRWSEDRYGDRYRQEEYRRQGYQAPEPYGAASGQSRQRSSGGYGESGYGGESYGDNRQRYDRDYEDRSFGSERINDPYAAGYAAYGEAYDRAGRNGSPASRGYDSRQASGSMLHQGYRAPFAGVRGDAQGYSNQGQGGYGAYGSNAASYAGYRPEYGAYAGQERGAWDQGRDEVASWFGDDDAQRRRRADEMRHELHRGRGPKGYTRSDDRIREDVNDRLTDDHLLDASDIDVKVSDGEVTLTGHIAHRLDKRRAEDLAERVAGVKHVQNNLRVKAHEATHTASSSATTTAAGAGGAAASRSN